MSPRPELCNKLSFARHPTRQYIVSVSCENLSIIARRMAECMPCADLVASLTRRVRLLACISFWPSFVFTFYLPFCCSDPFFREMTLFEAASFRRFRRRKAVRPNERSAVVKNTQSDLSRLVRTADRVVRKVNFPLLFC